MDEPMAAELDRARRVLGWAYDRARAGGYQLGSEEMEGLAQAEQAYEQARRQRRELLQPSPPRQRVIDLTTPVGVDSG